jgi:serine/threonine protein kinase
MGLDTIHKLGVMHRDLKTANIFLKYLSVEKKSTIKISNYLKKSDQE